MGELEEILNKQDPVIERNLLQVSMSRRRGGGGTSKGAAFECFCNVLVKFPTLGTRK